MLWEQRLTQDRIREAKYFTLLQFQFSFVLFLSSQCKGSKVWAFGGTTSHLGWLENIESVGVMRDRDRNVVRGPLWIPNYEGRSPMLYLVLPHELRVPAGAQVMGEKRNLSKYRRSKQEASCVSLRPKWAWEPWQSPAHLPFPMQRVRSTHKFCEETDSLGPLAVLPEEERRPGIHQDQPDHPQHLQLEQREVCCPNTHLLFTASTFSSLLLHSSVLLFLCFTLFFWVSNA